MLSQSVKRFYDPTFTISPEYKESLPDLQNGPASLIEGANVPIQQVGISNFKLPLHIKKRDGKTHLLEVSVDGYVSLDANKKGFSKIRWDRMFTTVGGSGEPISYLSYFLIALAGYYGWDFWRKRNKKKSS